MERKKYSLQELIEGLNRFWVLNGCFIEQPYDFPAGAGTFHPSCFFGSLNNKDISVSYVAPSRRPKDGRYGENPNRWQRYFQYQVLIKPPPEDIQQLYFKSLASVGIPVYEHDIRFVEDDWESPTLGATGLGWQVWLDGIEISQFTYFQKMGGQKLNKVSVEITYGLERISMFQQEVSDIKHINWSDKFIYGAINLDMEKDNCRFNFIEADIESLKAHYSLWKKDTTILIDKDLLYPAYDNLLCLSHYFNILDARGVLGIKERQGYIQEIRELAKGIATQYIKKANKVE
ncbi:MAG: glycine--tRNA ligase subunit alpha [Candidatus Coatesbacteria bacterium]|nr:glycine--tRNA ligase subunit alpha [Candidatus Coatesbacteria bacterium]